MKYTIVAVAGFATVANAFSNSAFNGKTTIAGVPKSTSALDMRYKVAVVGGGPSGACAAEIFAQEKGIDTVLFERKLDNAKPCGGAIPLCMVGEFDIPETVVDRKVRSKCIWTFSHLLFAWVAMSKHPMKCSSMHFLNGWSLMLTRHRGFSKQQPNLHFSRRLVFFGP